MGLLSRMFSKSQNSTALASQKKHEQEVMMNVARTRSELEKGLSKQTASTGRLLSEIHGNARTNAVISNCGGGSKATGGKGIQGGVDLLIKHSEAIGQAKEMIRNKKLNG